MKTMKQTEYAPTLLADGAGVKYEYDAKNRTACFFIRGEIDHHGAKTVREAMDEVISRYHPAKVRMDLSAVAFMDSAGLGLMLGRYTKISEYGGRLILVRPGASIMKILSLAGADKLIPIEMDPMHDGEN